MYEIGFLSRIAVGVRRHPLRLIASSFVAYSVIWTVLESSSYLVPQLKPQGWLAFGAMVLAGLSVGACRTAPPKAMHVRIKSLDMDIRVQFGDIFAANVAKVVPVNEYFDSALGDHVSKHSLHGQLITRYFSGHGESFDALVDQDLKSAKGKVVQRASGRTTKYPIGTTAVVNIAGDQFFLPVVAHTDIATLKASCDLPTLWQALAGLWETVRNRAGGAPVAVPLIGGGLSASGIPPAQLLRIIVLSAVSSSKRAHLRSAIHIVLPEDLFSEIDLGTLKDDWS